MIDTEVRKAKEILSSGGIILYPTDTIWGIGCDATNPDAVQRIYEIKQRSDSKSMLVLVPGTEMLSRYLESVPEKAVEIIKTANKPTTIIYPGARNLAPNLVAEDGSIGIRVTSDPFCRELTRQTGFPIVSTSANISGETSPALFSEIKPGILKQVNHVVTWRKNETKPTKPSAIIKIEDDGTLNTLRF